MSFASPVPEAISPELAGVGCFRVGAVVEADPRVDEKSQQPTSGVRELCLTPTVSFALFRRECAQLLPHFE